MRWTRRHRRTCDAFADGQVAWFWRPWAGAKPASDDLAGDGDYEVTDTGKSAKQPLTPSRGECRCFGFTCSDLSLCAFSLRTQGCGCSTTPGIPCALFCLREEVGAKLGHILPRDRYNMSLRCHARFPSPPRLRRGNESKGTPELSEGGKRGIQYSRGLSCNHSLLWNTGSPGQAGRRHRDRNDGSHACALTPRAYSPRA